MQKGDGQGRRGDILYGVTEGEGQTFICVAESTAQKFRKWMHENPNKTSEQKKQNLKKKTQEKHWRKSTQKLLQYFDYAIPNLEKLCL